jgi:hypothetical protein
MQVKRASKPLEIVVIVAHGRAGLQPLRLLMRTPRRKVNLDEFYGAGHAYLDVNLYCTMRGPGMRFRHSGNAAQTPVFGYHWLELAFAF